MAVEKKNKKIDIHPSNDTRVALLEQSIAHINETLIRFEKRFDKIDERFDKIDMKFELLEAKIDGKIDKLYKRIDGHFYFMLSMIFGLGAIMAHGFHWF